MDAYRHIVSWFLMLMMIQTSWATSSAKGNSWFQIPEDINSSVKIYEKTAETMESGIFVPGGRYMKVKASEGNITLLDCDENNICHEVNSLPISDVNKVFKIQRSDEFAVKTSMYVGTFATLGAFFLCVKQSSTCHNVLKGIVMKNAFTRGISPFVGLAVIFGGGVISGKTVGELFAPHASLEGEVSTVGSLILSEDEKNIEIMALPVGTFNRVMVSFSEIELTISEIEDRWF